MGKCSISYLFIQNIIARYIMTVTLEKQGLFLAIKNHQKHQNLRKNLNMNRVDFLYCDGLE